MSSDLTHEQLNEGLLGRGGARAVEFSATDEIGCPVRVQPTATGGILVTRFLPHRRSDVRSRSHHVSVLDRIRRARTPNEIHIIQGDLLKVKGIPEKTRNEWREAAQQRLVHLELHGYQR